MPKLKEETSEKNRKQILEAAEECFARDGFHKTNIRQIATKAGLSPGNLYRYFSSKDELVKAYVQYSFEDISDSLSYISDQRNFMKGLKTWCKEYIRESADIKIAALEMEIASEALHNSEIMEIIHIQGNALLVKFSNMLKEAQRQELLEMSLDSQLTANAIIGTLDHFISNCLFQKGYTIKKAQKDAEKVITTLIR